MPEITLAIQKGNESEVKKVLDHDRSLARSLDSMSSLAPSASSSFYHRSI